jgi:hypothetical protein
MTLGGSVLAHADPSFPEPNRFKPLGTGRSIFLGQLAGFADQWDSTHSDDHNCSHAT